jgi:hypothetical protein
MQLKAKHTIEEETRAKGREAVSLVQMEHRKAENLKCLPEVYNSAGNNRTTFDFVKIHLMLLYEKSVQCFGQLVKHSTETQEMNYPKMCIGHNRLSNSNIQCEQQMLNDNLGIHVH